jgi:two-component system, LytTR family, sensor kinase
VIAEPEVTSRCAVPFRTVIVSIVVVWGVYFVLVTLRSIMVDPDWYGDSLFRRALVSLVGCVVTVPIWLLLRQVGRWSIGARVAIGMLAALPAAMTAGWFNFFIFSMQDKSWMLDDGKRRVSISRNGTITVTGAGGREVIVQDVRSGQPVVVPIPPSAPRPPIVVGRMDDEAHSVWKEVSDIALGRYFLLLAWISLFLALTKAEEVRGAERQAAALRRAAKAAELRSLRYQVNPHFLFNTLNSLSALVMTGRKEPAERMIQTLSDFYRTSLTGDPTADVMLAEEVRLQRLYLEVESVRFPERLDVRFDLPDALADACVPGLILQPLVENAVKHGVSTTRDRVTIAIRAEQWGERLLLTVENDGGGSPREGGTGIGLANVRDRLQARFGDEARMEAGPVGSGYRVQLVMPIVRNGC